MSDRQSTQTRWWRGFLFSQRDLSDLGPLGEPGALAGTDWNRSRVSILSRLGRQAVVLWSLRRMLPTAMVAAMTVLCASLLLTVFAREASRHRRSNLASTDGLRRPLEVPAVEPSVDAVDREAAPWDAAAWDLERPDAPWSTTALRDLSGASSDRSPVPFSTRASFAPAASFAAPSLADPFADPARPAPSAYERP